MPSKTPVSLESIMDILKAHTDLLNQLVTKSTTKATSNETTEANSKTKKPSIQALLKEILEDKELNFLGCVAGTHSNPSIWQFGEHPDFVKKYKDDKKIVTEFVKQLLTDKDKKNLLTALLSNKTNIGPTTKIAKKKSTKSKKKESDSDSDSVPQSAKSSKKGTTKHVKVEEEEDEEDSD